MDSRQEIFFEVHRDLPREGPGDHASTWRALDLAGLDEAAPLVVVDAGCGPGMQTLDLAARLRRARFLAVDLHPPFLADLTVRAVAGGFADRVHPLRADIGRLPVAAAAVDLLWCEGAAYNVGVGAALRHFHEVLRPGGVCAFTEAVWLRPDPPPPVQEFWQAYPAMTDVADNRALVHAAGFELLGDFVLPAAAWWEYYGPLGERLASLEARRVRSDRARAVLAGIRTEIDLYHRYAAWYGYAFLVARKP